MNLKEDEIFLKIAADIAELSKCAKTHVAAVTVLEGRILSTGVNGTPPGYPNCCDVHHEGFDHAAHRIWADEFEIHAEQNSINDAASRGVSIKGATIYVTMQPCKQCTKNLTTAGIKRIVYSNMYDRISETETKNTETFLNKCGVEIEHKH